MFSGTRIKKVLSMALLFMFLQTNVFVHLNVRAETLDPPKEEMTQQLTEENPVEQGIIPQQETGKEDFSIQKEVSNGIENKADEVTPELDTTLESEKEPNIDSKLESTDSEVIEEEKKDELPQIDSVPESTVPNDTKESVKEEVTQIEDKKDSGDSEQGVEKDNLIPNEAPSTISEPENKANAITQPTTQVTQPTTQTTKLNEEKKDVEPSDKYDTLESLSPGQNLDGISGTGAIRTPILNSNIYPENVFNSSAVTNKSSISNKLLADGTPVIGVDHPSVPGEVMLFKEAYLVPGMVNTWDIKLRIEAVDVQETSDIVLVIDRSGSMDRNGKMTAAKTAAKSFVDTILSDPESNTNIAVVSFAEDVVVDQPLTNDIDSLEAAIDGLVPIGGTFTQAAIRQAQLLLNNSTASQKNIVLLSDGEPTYSYTLRNPSNHMTQQFVTETSVQNSFQTYTLNRTVNNVSSTNILENEFDYTSHYPSGRAMFHRITGGNNFNYNTDQFINHGNSTIAQASYAKNAGQRVWTVALQAGTQGNSVLNNVATPNSSFTSDPAQLQQIFQLIAGSIQSAVRDGKVEDYMGVGFEIPIGSVSSISTIPTTPGASYDTTTKSISWNPGTLTLELPDHPHIRYAELSYRVEINDDILTAPSTGGLFKTNAEANLVYTDVSDNTVTKAFDSPEVDPILMVLEKKILDSNGNEIVDTDTTFDVEVKEVNSTLYNKTYTLKQNERRVLTNLRYEEDYLVEEIAVSTGALSDYNTTLTINGEVVTGFRLTQGQEDVDIFVNNEEKPLGKITVEKVFIPTASRIARLAAPTFEFLIEGPNGYSKTFTLGAGGTEVFDNLVYGEYKITETNSMGFVETYEPAGGVVTVSRLSKEAKVTVTNRPGTGEDKTNVTATKNWVGGAVADHTAITLNLLKDGVLYTDVTPAITPDTPTSSTFNYAWNNLPRFNDDGSEIVYEVKEATETGGVSIINGNYYEVTYGDNNTITNKLRVIDVTGTKVWNGVPTGYETPDIQLQLVRNGTNFGSPVTLVSGETTYIWKDVPELDSEGQPYTYTVKEVTSLPDFTTTASGMTVTNTYKTVNKTGTKVWSGAPAGYVYPEIELQLQKDGVDEGEPVVLASGVLSHTWTGLPELKPDGTPYVYTVVEVTELPDFTTVASGLTVTNTYKTKDITGTKVWSGAPAGYVYPEIELQLQKDGVDEGEPVVLASGVLSHTWTGLPELKPDGTPYNYTVVEVTELPDFTTVASGLTVTNTYKSTDVTGTKIWNGGPNPKPNIELALYQNGELFEGPVTLVYPETTYTWTAVPLIDKEGNDYIYTVVEVTELLDYNKLESGLTVTNTYKTTSKTGTKTWAGVPEGYTVPAITLQLMQDGKAFGDPVELASGTLTYVWANLPELKPDGTPFVYTVVEVTELKDFDKVEEGLTVTNTYKTTSNIGTKNWVGVPEGYTVPAITLQLMQDGKPFGDPVELASGTLTYEWTNLPELKPDGTPFVYTVVEVTELKDFDKVEEGLTVTNTYKTVNKIGTKNWIGVPEAYIVPVITLQLMQDGKAFGDPVELASGVKNYEWTNLPELKPDGTPYVYTVVEVTELKDFDKVEDGMAVTNTYKTTSKTGTKTWAGVPEGYTLPAITLQLMQDGKAFGDPIELALGTLTYEWTNLPELKPDGTAYVYTVVEVTELKDFDKVEEGMTVTNTYKTTSKIGTKNWVGVPEGYTVPAITLQLMQDGKAFGDPVELASGTLTYEWTNLPELKPDGTAFVYTVVEVAEIKDFDKVEEGLTVTNTYKTTSVTGTKVWNNVPEGYTLPVIKLQLMQDGKAFGDPVELASGTLTYEWTNLPELKPDGTAYVYTVVEVTELKDFDKVEEGMTVTNTYKTTSKIGTKNWVGVPEGYTVPAISLQLMQDGKAFGDPVELASGVKNYEWMNLPELKPDGTPYVYTVVEVTELKDFDKVEDGMAVTNTYKTTSKTGTKTWAGVPEGYTLPAITLQLMQDGKAFGDPVELALGTLTYEWTNLPELKPDGTAYVYTVVEVTELKDFDKVEEGMTVTNTYKTTSKIGTKNWVGVPEGYTVPAITLQLMQDGKAFGDPVELASGTLTYEWTNLPELKPDGTAFVYTVVEVTELKDFDKVEEGLTVTNTYKTVSKIGTKNWVGVPEGYTVPAITLQLMQDGKAFGDPVELATGVKNYEWTNLPELKVDGTAYTYTVVEITELKDFDKTEDGMAVTNTYKTVNMTGTKTWTDVPTGFTLPVIKLQLMQDGKAFGDPVELASGTLSYEWMKLPELKADGTAYVYTVVEVSALPDFTKVESGMTVTNSYKLTEVTATKVWTGVPTGFMIPNIKLQLQQNGVNFGTEIEIVSPATSYTWKNLPAVDPNGEAYEYTVVETSTLAAFDATYSADKLTVTNTYKLTEVTAKKVWAAVPDGYTIPTVEFELLRDGKSTGEIVRLVTPNVSYTWKDLPKFGTDGKEYVYTVKELTKLADFKATYSSDKLTVTNTYVKKLPNTGEEDNMALPIAGFGLLAAGIFVLFTTRKKQSI